MRSYVISICFAVILCAAADMILPSKRYRGIVRIVCGIFVIGTIVSPIKKLINIDYSSLDTSMFLKDDYEFFSKVQQSEQSYRSYLTGNGKDIAEEEIDRELSELFGKDITVRIVEDGIVLGGAEESERKDITSYVKERYELNVTYED